MWYEPFELGSVTDLVGIGLAICVLGVSVWIAFRQFRIMNRQTAMMVEQGEIAKRQEQTSKRQGEIAERQHEIMERQLSRKPDLRIRIRQRRHSLAGSDIELFAENRGNGSVQAFSWRVLIPLEVSHIFELYDISGKKIDSTRFGSFPAEDGEDVGGHGYREISGEMNQPLFPDHETYIARVHVPAKQGPMSADAKWSIVSDAGRFPPNGFGAITLDTRIPMQTPPHVESAPADPQS